MKYYYTAHAPPIIYVHNTHGNILEEHAELFIMQCTNGTRIHICVCEDEFILLYVLSYNFAYICSTAF